MFPHNLHIDHESVHRIGSVSRLAGVPVSTLRMWEGRYGAFTPSKTGGKHRLYNDGDVTRARLLRQLTDCGHSIGGIARLPAQQLQDMLMAARAAAPGARADPAPRTLSVVVLGAALAARVNALGESFEGDVLHVQAMFNDVEDAFAADAARDGEPADVLLVRVNALQPAAVERLLALQSAVHARHGVLLYNFAATATLDALRHAGFILRREPIADADLAELIRSVTWAHVESPRAAVRHAGIPGRRYSDEQLAVVASSPTGMLCECPRHISEIISQLVSFEEYSASCLNESAEDAHVHARLRSVAGSARALFEGALEMALAHGAEKSKD